MATPDFTQPFHAERAPASIADMMRVERFTHRVERFQARVGVSRHILEGSKLHHWQDHVMDQLLYQMELFIPALEEKRVLSVPRTWWDAFKLQFFPEWALKRWPARRRHYDAKVFFPAAKMPPEQLSTYYGELAYPVFEEIQPDA